MVQSFFSFFSIYSDHFYFFTAVKIVLKCCKNSSIKIYSTLHSKFSIGGYYDSDKLTCRNISLQTNS